MKLPFKSSCFLNLGPPWPPTMAISANMDICKEWLLSQKILDYRDQPLMVLLLLLETLAVKYTWDTQCKSRDAEGAFLVCGTLHVVYNTGYGGRSTIQCLYDIHDTVHRLAFTQKSTLCSTHCKPARALCSTHKNTQKQHISLIWGGFLFV